ncbi:hypothetical protein SAMN05444416_107175 [Thermoactinomyces sp. DSM 45892]|nr:hypothetical protein SAMN05444416_107175 [Thermoactinomyces sp. DSM 45892]
MYRGSIAHFKPVSDTLFLFFPTQYKASILSTIFGNVIGTSSVSYAHALSEMMVWTVYILSDSGI